MNRRTQVSITLPVSLKGGTQIKIDGIQRTNY